MYGALWRVLPGPWWVRVLILVVAVAAILYAFTFWVFPFVNTLIPQGDVTVEGG